jgi:RimJ/RimL family protein N-acetyltransferase
MIDHGHGVLLGPVDRTMLPKLRGWRNSYRVWRWCRQNDLISDVDQERWFEAQSKDPSIKMYAIWEDDKMVGVCGLTSIDLYNRRAEFSLYVAPEYQGNGYGERALKTLFSHGFKTLGLNLIWGETFQGNRAAELFREIGLKHEGVRRQFYFREGQFWDTDLFSMTAVEWKS